MVASQSTANLEIGLTENTTPEPDLYILPMSVHVLVTLAVVRIQHLEVLVIGGPLVVPPTLVLWRTAGDLVGGSYGMSTRVMGLCTASIPLTAPETTATTAEPTELLCGKMAAVNNIIADPVDGQAENIAQLQGEFIPRM